MNAAVTSGYGGRTAAPSRVCAAGRSGLIPGCSVHCTDGTHCAGIIHARRPTNRQDRPPAAGSAGLFAARALRSAPPLLYQCVTGILSEGKIAYPLRHLVMDLRNLGFEIAEATGLDARQLATCLTMLSAAQVIALT